MQQHVAYGMALMRAYARLCARINLVHADVDHHNRLPHTRSHDGVNTTTGIPPRYLCRPLPVAASLRSVVVVGFVVASLGLAAGCQGTVPADPDGEVVATRAPLPEPTPGIVERELTEAAEGTRLSDNPLADAAVGPLVNVGLALLFVVVGYFLGIWVLNLLQRRVLSRIAPQLADAIHEALDTQLRRLILVCVLYYAIWRLHLPSEFLKRALLDVLFLVGISLISIVLWRAQTVFVSAYEERLADSQRRAEVEPAVQLLVRLSRILLTIVIVTITLGHFGINVAALAAAVGLVGLALSLAAKDTIADAIAGMIILFDKPFRVGDRIEIEKANTWGDVTDIGLRSTRILTRDNRLVVIPNSIIGENQIVNYSYPDPFYRIQIHVGIAYGTDIEFVRRLMIDTVTKVEGVYAEKGIDALYVEMGDSAMIFRVRWWIETYADTRRMVDKVNSALQRAFDEHGVACPYPTQSIVLQQESTSAL